MDWVNDRGLRRESVEMCAREGWGEGRLKASKKKPKLKNINKTK